MPFITYLFVRLICMKYSFRISNIQIYDFTCEYYFSVVIKLHKIMVTLLFRYCMCQAIYGDICYLERKQRSFPTDITSLCCTKFWVKAWESIILSLSLLRTWLLQPVIMTRFISKKHNLWLIHPTYVWPMTQVVCTMQIKRTLSSQIPSLYLAKFILWTRHIHCYALLARTA
jgi:hypothetical protein